MKRSLLKNTFIALLVVFIYNSCTDKITDTPKLLVSTTHSLEFAANNNQEAIIEVETTCDSWEYSVPEWVIANKAENSLIVNVTDNEGEARTDSIIFAAKNVAPVALLISQAAHIDTVIPTPQPSSISRNVGRWIVLGGEDGIKAVDEHILPTAPILITKGGH